MVRPTKIETNIEYLNYSDALIENLSLNLIFSNCFSTYLEILSSYVLE